MVTRARFISAALSLVAGLCVCLAAAAQLPDEEPKPQALRPVRIATLPSGSSIVKRHGLAVVWSPDGKRAAWVAERDGSLMPMWTSKDGLHFGATYDYVEVPTFSDDSAHVVFSVGDVDSTKKERWSLLVDGEVKGKYDWAGGAHFWPGSSELVYWTRPGARISKQGYLEGGSFVLQVGNRKGKKWSKADTTGPRGGLVYARDGSRAVAAAAKGSNWSTVVVGVKGQSSVGLRVEVLRDLGISADGEQWAAATVRPAPPGARPGGAIVNRWLIRRGDEEIGGIYDSADMPTFAPSESRLAYRVKSHGKNAVVIEGGAAAQLLYAAITEIAWEPLGHSTGFMPGDEGLAFIGSIGPDPRAADPDASQWRVVRYNGAGEFISESEAFREVRDLTIAPGGVSSLNLAYCVRDRERGPWRLVREWVEDGDLRSAVSNGFDFMGPPIWTEDGFRAGVVDGDSVMMVQTRDR